MSEKSASNRRRGDRYKRLVIDYSETTFHQNEQIIHLLKEILDQLKKAAHR